MTELESLLYRIGQAQVANDREPVDGFGCSHEEAKLVTTMYKRGWIGLPRRQILLDGVLLNGLALTAIGIREWSKLHQVHADPSGK